MSDTKLRVASCQNKMNGESPGLLCWAVWSNSHSCIQRITRDDA